MNIPSIDNFSIKFTIKNNNIPIGFLNKWIELKNIFENDNFQLNETLISTWLKQCELESNKNLPYLNRANHGIGGNNNSLNKQIRFMEYKQQKYYTRIRKINKYTIFIPYVYNTENEKWKHEELDDLINAFIKFASGYTNINNINGCLKPGLW
jgi:hypothetical protein